MQKTRGRIRAMAAGLALILLVVVAAASFLPLIETNVWWVRYLDFPRVQLAAAILLLLSIYLVLRGWPRPFEWIAVVGALVALGYQGYTLYPYSRMATPAAEQTTVCNDGQALRIMVANVKRRNERAEDFLYQVETTDPDLLLVMETDAWWDERLTVLRSRFRHVVQSIPEDNAHFGMHLFSKLDLISPEFRLFFDATTPTVVSQVRMPGGGVIEFIGLHPKPPLAWSQPTTMRDALLLQAALHARETDVPTILAGDFNATPWERVTRRSMRIGGLLDPRVGRGLFPTFDTESLLISWPLDQILFQPQFTLGSFGTLPDFGSDHRAVVATLCLEPTARQGAPNLRAHDLAEAQRSLDAARRAQPSLPD